MRVPCPAARIMQASGAGDNEVVFVIKTYAISDVVSPRGWSMPRFQGLIFDLDGTLVDSAPDLRQALNADIGCAWPP